MPHRKMEEGEDSKNPTFPSDKRNIAFAYADSKSESIPATKNKSPHTKKSPEILAV